VWDGSLKTYLSKEPRAREWGELSMHCHLHAFVIDARRHTTCLIHSGPVEPPLNYTHDSFFSLADVMATYSSYAQVAFDVQTAALGSRI
jgi:hypothetical protein